MPMSNIASSISDSETQVLLILWEASPLSAAQIITKLSDEEKSHPKTVKTLINRLLKKGAIGFHEKDRKYYYHPLIEKAEFYKVKTDLFLGRFFNGEVTPLVSFFSSQNSMDEKDIAELKMLIEKMENKNGE